MKYIKVKWKHTNSEYPVMLYSELDDDRWELRKVEIFLDGRQGYANSSESTDSTALGDSQIPELAVIAADPQFEPVEITQEEFEDIWRKRVSE